ncbi:Heat shock protein 70 (Hsp 70) family protein isoform 1 [Hibiscus syriacus]|uniref:Heat shock protein 70 (Hsp 70) family protein isoform 1 n=1 Tax=Hibiscus syriacus TaxID=106335 RepID=A0A6A3D2M7_HIBSY|nr:Heat shock protein 70 (Hsp 70) family protein isoform 1 [Hibiscus syriacus]
MLVPQFSDSSEGPPFICAPLNGPFPSGFSPFVPISGPQGSHSTPDLDLNGFNSTAMPIRSFRIKNLSQMDTHSSHKKKSIGSSSDKKKTKVDKSSKLSFTASSNFDTEISLSKRDDDNRELVENVLLRFDALRRKLIQMEDRMESHSSIIKREDLKAGNTMMSKGSMAGIFYIKGDLEGELVALSIVSSGGYDNNTEDLDILIYSGQGGNASRDKEASDQKLEKGNLAL